MSPDHPLKTRDLKFLWTAILMTLAVVLLASFALKPFLYVVSGQLFASNFDRIHAGWALDQPTIGKWFFLFTLFAAMVFPYVAIVRLISDRRTRLGYWAFVVPTVVLCLCLFSVLTLPFYWLLQYIDAMGFTSLRSYGLLYGLSGYIVVLGFLCWTVCPPKRERK